MAAIVRHSEHLETKFESSEKQSTQSLRHLKKKSNLTIDEIYSKL